MLNYQRVVNIQHLFGGRKHCCQVASQVHTENRKHPVVTTWILVLVVFLFDEGRGSPLVI